MIIQINYYDNSLIFFEDYNSLKSNVLVYENFKNIKNYKFIKTIGITPTEQKKFLKTYTQKDLIFIDFGNRDYSKTKLDTNPIFYQFFLLNQLVRETKLILKFIG